MKTINDYKKFVILFDNDFEMFYDNDFKKLENDEIFFFLFSSNYKTTKEFNFYCIQMFTDFRIFESIDDHQEYCSTIIKKSYIDKYGKEYGVGFDEFNELIYFKL